MQPQPAPSMIFTPVLREELRFAIHDALKQGKGRADSITFHGNKFVIAYASYLIEHLDTALPEAELVKPALQCEICPAPIGDLLYDARLISGTMWSHMCPKCYEEFGTGKFGPNDARMLRRQSESLFVQVK